MNTKTNTRSATRIAVVSLIIALGTIFGINATTAHATAGATTEFAFSAQVTNTGEQDAVDACTGGLTHMTSVSDYLGKPYYPIHNNCGGADILNLTTGDQVQIDNTTYTVITTTDVTRGDSATTLTNLPGDALLQTCHTTGNTMRVVALEMN